MWIRGLAIASLSSGIVSACSVPLETFHLPAVAQQAYIKASDTAADDIFGVSVALSRDGSTLAVGARGAVNSAGAVYMFSRSGMTWRQQADVKASNADAGDLFGTSVALSGDGSTLAVGAIYEASMATGIGGNQSDNTAPESGAVYVFIRSGTTWSQPTYVKASNTGTGDNFGASVALSDDGSTLAVGANRERSAATGVDGNQSSDLAMYAGAVYVFAWSGTTWSQEAYVKPSNTDAHDEFGNTVALSGDGSMLAVGASFEDGAVTGVGGDPSGNTAPDSGAVYVFARHGTAWSQEAYVKASNTGAGDAFGTTVALSGDGSILAVGAEAEASAATGIDRDQNNDSAVGAGAVYLFAREATTWSQEAYVKASNTDAFDTFGTNVALSGDGSTLAVAAAGESSTATGIDGDQTDNSASKAGAVYLFARNGTTWRQEAYLKASNTEADDGFGGSIALSADGSTLVVGASAERSAATGIDGNQTNNSVQGAGAVYAFARSR